MYINDIKLSAISTIYQVDRSVVRYHLEVAGVYEKNKRGSIDLREIKKQNQGTSFNFYHSKGTRFNIIGAPRKPGVVDTSHERNFPKSYAEYVQREKDKHSILYKNGIRDTKYKPIDPDHDTDFFQFPRHRSPIDLEERRERTPVTAPLTVLNSHPVTVQDAERLDHHDEPITKRESEVCISITF